MLARLQILQHTSLMHPHPEQAHHFWGATSSPHQKSIPHLPHRHLLPLCG